MATVWFVTVLQRFEMAESEGFEPPEGLTLRLISSQLH